MSDYLIEFNGRHFVARPAAMIDDTYPCHDCNGLGMRPGARKTCLTCGSTGRVRADPDEREYRLCWVTTDGGEFICWDYDDRQTVTPLPLTKS